MQLMITNSNWDNLHFIIKEKQKDYDDLEQEKICIFVYGYPFYSSGEGWILAKEVYKLYKKKELNFINEIDGIYSIIILDKIKEICYVILDRYGAYSLFYFRNKNNLVISDILSEITKHIKNIRINQQSIIEYLNFGFKLGNKTHIKDIFEFEPATIYQIKKDLTIKEKRYWNYLEKIKDEKISNEELGEIFNTHILNATNLEKKISLPLTGGIDTRTILSACLPIKKKLHCYTHGIRSSYDVKLALKICRYFNIEHSLYDLDKKWIYKIPSLLKKNAEIFNGLVSSLSFLHVKESYKKEEKNGDLFLTGVLGNEIWRCVLGKKVVNAKDINEISAIITNHYMKKIGCLKNIYKGYNEKQIIEKIQDSVKQELIQVSEISDPVAQTEFFVYKNYCSNWASNSLKAAGKHFKVVSAMLQKDFIQNNRLLNLREKSSGFIEKYIISKNSSYLAKLPLDVVDVRHGGTIEDNLISKIKGRLLVWPRHLRTIINKLFKKVFKLDIFRPLYFTDYPNWLIRYHKEFLQEILNYNKMVLKNIFKRAEFENIINSFLKGDTTYSLFMIRLLSLEIWLRRIKKYSSEINENSN